MGGDGGAVGSTPASIVIAVPAPPAEICAEVRGGADECGFTPEPFHAVGLWYEDRRQTSNAEVRTLLAGAAPHCPSAPHPKYSIR